MKNAGFKALCRGTCVGHGYAWPANWDVDVEIFGCKISPGDLIHADKHGFLIIPPEDQNKILEAVAFMDANECNTVIEAARASHGQTTEEFLRKFNDASAQFGHATLDKFGKKGEW